MKTLLGILILLLAACAPALNWREVRMEGSGALALFPCRPAHETRRIELAGVQVFMSMQVCSAEGMRFALAEADIGDPARVGAALEQLARSQARNLDAPLPPGHAASVPGMTPQPAARELALRGRRPDGSEIQAQLLLFAKGTRVLQATVLGSSIDARVARNFMEELRLPS